MIDHEDFEKKQYGEKFLWEPEWGVRLRTNSDTGQIQPTYVLAELAHCFPYGRVSKNVVYDTLHVNKWPIVPFTIWVDTNDGRTFAHKCRAFTTHNSDGMHMSEFFDKIIEEVLPSGGKKNYYRHPLVPRYQFMIRQEYREEDKEKVQLTLDKLKFKELREEWIKLNLPEEFRCFENYKKNIAN